MKKIFDICVRLFAAFIVCFIILGVLFYGSRDDYEEDLGGGYTFYWSSGGSINGPDVEIPMHILNYSSSDRFIIVKQTPNGERTTTYYDKYKFNYPSLLAMYYWIIDKDNRKYYGPLTEQEFVNKGDSLGLDISFNPKNERKTKLKFKP